MADAGPLKDIRVQLKTRMDKAVEDFRKAMAATRTGRASGNGDDDVAYPKADGSVDYIRRVRSGSYLEWRRCDRQVGDAVIDDELVGNGRSSAIGNQDRYWPKRRRRACSRRTAL